MSCGPNTNFMQSRDLANHPAYTAAERLASLLLASPEYQHFMQLSGQIYADPQASPLLHQLKIIQSPYFRSDDDQAANQILAELHALPIMKEYDAAEEQVKVLFGIVNDIIGQAAGLPFAENAVASGSG